MEVNEVHTGAYAKIIAENPLLSREEEIALVNTMHGLRACKRRTAAREKLINSNIRLATKEAYNYGKNSNFPIEDLINAGIEGLCIAVDKFNPNKFHTKLSTYAIPWIKLKITRTLTKGQSHIYTPPHILLKSRRMSRVQDEDANLTDEELMAALDVTEMGLKNIRLSKAHVVSLSESRYTDDEDTTVGDVIPDVKTITSREIFATKEIKDFVISEVAKLNDVSNQIITRRFLKDVKEDLGEIGASLDLTGERVRQIEFKALRILRKRMKSRSFFGA